VQADSKLIKKFIRLIEAKTGATLIIYDDYRILTGSGEFADMSGLKRWHLNPYCIQMKERGMHRWCVGLKEQYNKKVAVCAGVCSSTCFCGVTEIAVPVIVEGKMLLTVAAAGLYGPLRTKMKESLSRKTGVSAADLEELRTQALMRITDTQKEELALYLETVSCLLREYILRRKNYDRDFSEMLEADVQNGYVQKALGYINEHFMEQLDVETIAAVCNLNSSYLQHLFSARLGHGIGEEIRMCRIHYACALLEASDRPIKNIALSSGFYNVDYFCTVFKRSMGISPLKYRKAHCNSYNDK